MNPPPFAISQLEVLISFATAATMAIACATLSVFVVSRRWAFIGEGISHSGFGGAGTAWLLALLFPAMGASWVPYAGVVIFCLVTALAIGYLTRSQRINSDTAIGIFLVASLAWGIMARELYRAKLGHDPVGWDTFLFGEMGDISRQFSIAAAMVCAAVVITLAALGKEIIFYCFDPAMAQASGVRAGFIHYLLMLLVALTIVVGVRIAGTLLVTALLVLPGATALQISDRLRATLIASIVVGVIGAVGGFLLYLRWRFLPTGPLIVLVLFAQFLIAYSWARISRTTA